MSYWSKAGKAYLNKTLLAALFVLSRFNGRIGRFPTLVGEKDINPKLPLVNTIKPELISIMVLLCPESGKSTSLKIETWLACTHSSWLRKELREDVLESILFLLLLWKAYLITVESIIGFFLLFNLEGSTSISTFFSKSSTSFWVSFSFSCSFSFDASSSPVDVE
jgi:hypothetical protein